MNEKESQNHVDNTRRASPVKASCPSDGEYRSMSGRLVTVSRRPVPDSKSGSVEIAVEYASGGAGKEFYCLAHHPDTPDPTDEDFRSVHQRHQPARQTLPGSQSGPENRAGQSPFSEEGPIATVPDPRHLPR